MNHELSTLTLEDIRENLSSDPDVLTQDLVNQISSPTLMQEFVLQNQTNDIAVADKDFVLYHC